MENNKKVLVAFSGGLDTSFCVKYLKEDKGYEVHTALVNTGGFPASELDTVTEKALALGAVSHKNIDITQEFYEKAVRYMIFGNVLRGNTYPISVSSERVFQAIAIISYAKEIGAKAVAHGPVFLPGESQGQRSLVGCRLWGRTELDTTEAT